MSLHRIQKIAYAIGFMGIVYWMLLLSMTLSTVSRGDFLWEMWHIGPAIENNDWASILGLIFKIFGGHIAVYTRVLQIFNYIAFDYSGIFTKYSNVMAHFLACLSVFYAAKKIEGISLRGAFFFLWGIIYITNPISYNNIGWIDSNVSYYAVNIGLFFMLPSAIQWMKSEDWSAKVWLKALLFCFLLVIGSGVGWGSLLLVFVAWSMNSRSMQKIWKSGWRGPVLYGAACLTVLYLLWLFVIYFTQKFQTVFYLDDLNRAFTKLGSQIPFVLKFSVSVFAIPFTSSPVDKAWIRGVLIFAIWVASVITLIRKNKIAENYFYFMLTVFGVITVGLIGIGRWEIASNHSVAVVPVYYVILIMPFFMGLPFLVFAAIQEYISENKRVTAALTTLVLILAFAINSQKVYASKLRTTKEWYEAARFGSQNWNLIMQVRLSGSTTFAVEYLMGVMPDLKAWGKDKALTESFISEPEKWVYEQRLSVPSFDKYKTPQIAQTCFPHSDILAVEEDLRDSFYMPGRNPETHFVRASGYVVSPTNCAVKPEFVFLADKEGRVLCVSRPGMKNWDIEKSLHSRLEKHSDAIIDFSCPIGGQFSEKAPFQLFALFKEQGLLLRIGTSLNPL